MIADTVGYPETPKPQAPWAARLQKAHVNAMRKLAFTAAFVGQALFAWQLLG
jgi:hypothetical protein